MTTKPTFSDDWRKPPPERRCDSCDATQTGCDARRMLSGRACCESCDGDHTKGVSPDAA